MQRNLLKVMTCGLRIFAGSRSHLVVCPIYSDKKELPIKHMALSAYPVHFILSNMSAITRQCSICNGHTLVGFPAFFVLKNNLKKKNGHEIKNFGV